MNARALRLTALMLILRRIEEPPEKNILQICLIKSTEQVQALNSSLWWVERLQGYLMRSLSAMFRELAESGRG